MKFFFRCSNGFFIPTKKEQSSYQGSDVNKKLYIRVDFCAMLPLEKTGWILKRFKL